MSDYRFGDDYKLNIYPKEAMGYDGLDMDKIESVEVEWVDFVRKPDDKSRWFQLFGTPERAARTLLESTSECRCCVIRKECGYDLDKCVMYDRDALLEWLRGDA